MIHAIEYLQKTAAFTDPASGDRTDPASDDEQIRMVLSKITLQDGFMMRDAVSEFAQGLQ